MKYNWSCNVLGGDVSQWTMLCKFKCYTYQLTSSNRKKRKGKKVYERSYKHLPFKVFTVLLSRYPTHSVRNSLELIARATLNLNKTKIWLLGALATFQVFSSNLLDSTGTEHFHHYRKFYWRTLPLSMPNSKTILLKSRNSSMSPLLPSG